MERNDKAKTDKHSEVRSVERACDILLSFTKQENQLSLGRRIFPRTA